MTARPSSLRDALEDYLVVRRSLGFKLHSAGRLLGQFVGYLEGQGTNVVTVDNALGWATLPANRSPHWLAIRMRAVRGFARYLLARSVSPGANRAGVGAARVRLESARTRSRSQASSGVL